LEVKIGIQMAPRELIVETTASPEEVKRLLTAALSDGGVFELSDSKRGTILVPGDKVAYIELDVAAHRQIGFGS
jgi:Protein of unknown function (DUF3107)